MQRPFNTAIVVVVIGGALASLLVGVAAAQKLRPGRLSSEDRKALRAGLKLAFESQAAGKAASDVRGSRLAALHVPAGAPPTPFLPPGQFGATFTGYVKLKLKGEYVFQVKGRGQVTLRINDQVVLASSGQADLTNIAPVKATLVKGYNKLHVSYESPPQGDATLRVYWTGDDFPTEPLPPQLLMCDGRDEALRRGQVVRDGRLLLAERSCLKCHDLPGVKNLAQGMPELGKDSPSLVGVGSRLNADWMVQWMLEPSQLRTKPTMPRLLHALDEKQGIGRAKDIAKYLGTLEGAKPQAVETSDELVELGQIFFEDLGCIGCHRLSPPEEKDEYHRASMHFIAAKFRPGALADFLRAPHKHYTWSRMPDMKLNRREAESIEAFVRANAKGTIDEKFAANGGDASRGKELFNSTGCANCHAVEPDKPVAVRPRRPLRATALDMGCLAEVANKAPRLGLDNTQRAALKAFLATDGSSLGRMVPAEFSSRQTRRLLCFVCHRRDAADNELPYIIEDEGSQGHPPEVLPALTFAGEKLHPKWTEQLLAGQLGYRPRPHLKGRMGAFPARAKGLAIGLSHEHGFPEHYADGPKFDPAMAKQGRLLSLQNNGFNCVQCHGVGSQKATADFDARSTNLAFARDRLRHEYYQRWLLFPQRIAPGTKMPRFSPDGKKTALEHAYGGNAHKQYEALWHYLKTLQGGGREGERERGRERGREGGRERGREGEREEH
ncbi:MAG: hypothetical protein IID44_19415 [Planctomycetes bacterium]|nr:hypothetical protein [Planctomycetota bacterium]